MNGRKVLVVDDDELVLRLLKSRLTAAGCEVLTTVDPSEAVNLAHETSPDLFILDLNFPSHPTFDWHGFGIAEWLRCAGRVGRKPVIFITVDDIEQHKAQAERFKPSAIFGKPMDLQPFLATIERFLSAADRPPRASEAPAVAS